MVLSHIHPLISIFPHMPPLTHTMPTPLSMYANPDVWCYLIYIPSYQYSPICLLSYIPCLHPSACTPIQMYGATSPRAKYPTDLSWTIQLPWSMKQLPQPPQVTTLSNICRCLCDNFSSISYILTATVAVLVSVPVYAYHHSLIRPLFQFLTTTTAITTTTTTTITTAGVAVVTGTDDPNGSVVLGIQIDTRSVGGHVSFYRNNLLLHSFDNLTEHPSMHLLRATAEATAASTQLRQLDDGAEGRIRDSASSSKDAVGGGSTGGGDGSVEEENKTKGVRPFVCFESPNDSVVFLGRPPLFYHTNIPSDTPSNTSITHLLIPLTHCFVVHFLLLMLLLLLLMLLMLMILLLLQGAKAATSSCSIQRLTIA